MSTEKTCIECNRRFPKDELLPLLHSPQGRIENAVCIECSTEPSAKETTQEAPSKGEETMDHAKYLIELWRSCDKEKGQEFLERITEDYNDIYQLLEQQQARVIEQEKTIKNMDKRCTCTHST